MLQDKADRQTDSVCITWHSGTFVQLFLQWKKQTVLHVLCVSVCVCSLGYPACSAHAPYCHPWPDRLYRIFPHHLINGTICERKKSYWIQNACFDLLYKYSLKHFSFREELSELLSQMYIGLHIYYPVFLSDLKKIGFSLQIFEKHSNIKFHENTSSGSRVVSCGRTDSYDEANRRLVAIPATPPPPH
jgi:hypothetical protein